MALSNSDPDKAAIPALAAIGGWSDADWFCPSVLSDPGVVGFELPKLPGLRHQSFQVIDRTQAAARSGRGKQEPKEPARRMAGRLAQLLDSFGTTRAVASGRPRLLFEAAPVLFFAEIPTARIKPRPANKLRRELVALGLGACVVRVDATAATLMMWSYADQAITDFVDAAAPEHAIHADFAAARSAPAKHASPQPAPAARAAKAHAVREARLLSQIAMLQTQVEALTRAQSAKGAMEQLGLDDARLKSMLKLLHPDKHANSDAATEAAKWLNSMRDLLKDGAAA